MSYSQTQKNKLKNNSMAGDRKGNVPLRWPRQMPKIILNDYREERNYSEFTCWGYTFLIYQEWNQTKGCAMS